MLSYLLKTTLCWSLFYLLYHVWLGKETFFKINRWYLLATVLLGLLIPVINFQWLVPGHEEQNIVYYMQPIAVGVDQLETVIITASSGEAGFDWWGLLIKIYWLGAAFTFGRFFYGIFKINKLYNEGEKSFFNNYQFILTNKFHVPFSFFKNLFWSKDFTVDGEDRQNILRHEEAHIFQWHSVDIILLEIIGVLFWCSPFIYLYKKAIKTTHEYLADDYVVAQSGRKKYGQLLLRQSQSVPQGLPWRMQVALSNSLFSSQLKNRIVMMTKNKSNKLASLKYLALLPLLALLFLAFSSNENSFSRDGLGSTKTITMDTIPDLSSDDILKVAEEMPRFPGCEGMADPTEQSKCSEKKFMDFILSNVNYPKGERENGFQVEVDANFIVEKNGGVHLKGVCVKSENGSAEGYTEEVVRLFSLMPKWIPGKQRGEYVGVEYHLPFKFQPKPEPEVTVSNDLSTGEIFKIVEEMPIFPGCAEIADKAGQKKCSDEKMLHFVYNNIKYPKEAKEKGIEGMAVVKFIIEKDGSVTNAEIIRSVGGGCDEEVLKMVDMMPNWVPGKQRGRTVRVQFNLPVKFKLDSPATDIKDGPINEAPIVLKAFPNPAKDKLSLEMKMAPGNYKLTITDPNGKVFYSKELKNYDGETLNLNDVPLKDAPRGIVYMTIMDEKGKAIKNTSVVLQ